MKLHFVYILTPFIIKTKPNTTMLPIFITGAPRSGKTIIAEALAICGVFAGDVSKMKENVMLGQMLAEYLNRSGFDRNGYLSFPKPEELAIPQTWRKQVDEELRAQGYTHGPWLFKSHNITTTWPLYAHAYPNAKFIMVRRPIEAIADGCMKTSYIKQCAYSTKAEWVEVAKEYEKRMEEMNAAKIQTFTVCPHLFAQGDYSQMFALLKWLGLTWKNEVLETIDPKFWKVRKQMK